MIKNDFPVSYSNGDDIYWVDAKIIEKLKQEGLK